MKESGLPIVEISQLTENSFQNSSFSDELCILDLDEHSNIPLDKNRPVPPIRLNGLAQILVLNGSLKIGINYVEYEVARNSILTIMPNQIVQFLQKSEDMLCRVLVVSPSIFEGSGIVRFPSSMRSHLFVLKKPVQFLTPAQADHIDRQISHIVEKTALYEHYFHREVVQISLSSYFLELINIFHSYEKIDAPQLSRREELFESFLRLLFENVKKEHRVTFYAEKLFITSQYLSLVLKELSGKSANRWIDEALIIEAKVLLKAPRATVQRVADELNFPDQSSFGKFFKKQTGMTPMDYRRS